MYHSYMIQYVCIYVYIKECMYASVLGVSYLDHDRGGMYVYSVLVLYGLILGVAGKLGRIVEVSRGNRFAYRLRIVRIGASFNLQYIHTSVHTYIHLL